MKRLVVTCIALCVVTLFPNLGFAINYAHLDYGASIYDYSSGLDNWQAIVPADPRDVIGGNFSEYYTGETGNFIFDLYDEDQYIVVDLGMTRKIEEVGSFLGYEHREVWDYFGVSVAVDPDPSSFTLVGSIGTKGDGIRDVFTQDAYFTLSQPLEVRYLRYEFGEYSHYANGGSRVMAVYANGSNVVPEPATMFLFGGGLLGICAFIRQTRGAKGIASKKQRK